MMAVLRLPQAPCLFEDTRRPKAFVPFSQVHSRLQAGHTLNLLPRDAPGVPDGILRHALQTCRTANRRWPNRPADCFTGSVTNHPA